MIKRILVALDPDEDTPVATRYAVDIAQRSGAEVAALAVVNMRHIAAEVGPGGAVGGMYYAEQIRQHRTSAARGVARDLVAEFEAALAEAGLRHAERIEEGVPFQRIVEDMKYYDLLVVGSKGHYQYDQPDQETGTLARIVKHGVAPTLVVGKGFDEVTRVVIAYDGSDPAARTLQRFAQFSPFGKKVAVELVQVVPAMSAGTRHDSELLLRLAAGFLRAHGYRRIVETSQAGDDPAERLIEHARQSGAGLIVAGAHSVSAVRRLAFGSTTHALLQHGGVPLFLFH